MIASLKQQLPQVDAVIVGDYGKGVVTQRLLNELKPLCREHGVWLSLDPKPMHQLNLAGLSLITPNRKETFALARVEDATRHADPFADKNLMLATEQLLRELNPALLLITLGELGMLLCQRGQPPFHIPTVAQEVFDVSGAGDTVIATFTLAIAAGPPQSRRPSCLITPPASSSARSARRPQAPQNCSRVSATDSHRPTRVKCVSH
ncbi:MAG: PfkB family carbohydrate kinase [Verrucomicrobiota bacterium]